jgi:hypothetical protein
MINSSSSEAVSQGDDAKVEEIVSSGPHGAIAVAGVATAIVIALWFAFYLLVFLPRSP